VVSKPQIIFESPAIWRGFASDIFILRCSASVPRIENAVRHKYWRTIGH
jgi:hypothetical protein